MVSGLVGAEPLQCGGTQILYHTVWVRVLAQAALQSHWVERRLGVAENTEPMAALAV